MSVYLCLLTVYLRSVPIHKDLQPNTILLNAESFSDVGRIFSLKVYPLFSIKRSSQTTKRKCISNVVWLSSLWCCIPTASVLIASGNRFLGVYMRGINIRQCGRFIAKTFCSNKASYFIYAITFNIFQNTSKRQELFSWKRTTFVYGQL
jgi:hypothetical protein